MKKKKRIRKNKLINTIKRGFKTFYGIMEKPFSESNFKVSKKIKEFNKTKEDRKWLKEILTTNKIVRKFYKRPELEIGDFENVSLFCFKSRDNIKLAGLIYEPNKNSNKWVIASHWFAGHKSWALHHAMTFVKMGYNIISYDFRGHGQSQNYSTTMGGKEHFDLMGAVDWLKENRKIDQLAFMGTSMGGFVSNYCSVLYQEELKKLNFKFIISDVAYASIFTLFLHIKKVYLWVIPKIKTKKFINKIIEKQNKQESNINLHEVNLFTLLEKKGNKNLFPTLFFHSTDDRVTSPTDTYELIIKRSFEQDDFLMFNFSMHTQAIRYHFKSFNYKMAEFISKFEKDKTLFKNIIDDWKLAELEKKDEISILLK
ncbi:alpha/beta hydrolase [Spiroplasma endosymbiont of Atherix ibis]|uniref:alpha/beta hydrolase n=1 Tax=Spiroplasma endosymbiont of Atherix ibis TaxID=3066291 RepID=UPI0030D164AE